MKKHKIFLHTILLFCIVLLFSFLIPSFTKIIRHNIQLVQATSALEAPLSPEEQKAKEIASRSKYDAREDKIVPPVRNQGSWNLCWAYSAIAATEINLIKHGWADPTTIGLSSQNLSYNLNNRQDDPLHNTYEDVYDNIGYNKGGWAELAADILTQWRGLSSSNYLGYDKNEFILKECSANIPTDTTSLKQAVATYGSVVFSYIAPSSSNITYYNNQKKGINHQSVIIGWDDSISKTHFSPQPTHDGAWIVRNSWGANAHNNGYFYFSYDSLFHSVTVFDYVKSTEYDNNYFYDANSATSVGVQTFSNYQDYFKMGNIFEVKKKTATNEELLKAVNIGVYGKDVTTEIQIYTQLASLHAAPDSGILSATKTVNLPRNGYYTIDLDTPISLDNSQFFSIVVKLTNQPKNASLYCEISSLSTYDFCYHYDITSNTWKTSKEVYPNKTGRIKAYTIDRARTSTPTNDLAFATVEGTQPYTIEYTEQLQYPTYKVTFNNTTLVQNTDYTITYTNNQYPGIAKALIQGKGKYNGSKLMTWNIIKAKTPPNLPGTQDTAYGSTKRVLHVSNSVSVYAQIPLPTGWRWVFPDYTVKIGENRDNYVQYYDEQNYVRTMFDTIVIKDASATVTDISSAQINILDEPFHYTGSAIQPQISVVLNSATLVANTDYIVNYNNNINAGTAQLTIQGIGQYTGSITKNFTIEKAERPYSNPPSTLTIHADTDLTTVDFGSDWQLVDSNTTIAVGETKDIEVIHKNAHNYKTGTTATVRITRLQASTPPITTPQPPTPQPTPPITSPSDSQTTTTTKNNAYLFFSVGGGVLVLIGAISLTIFFIKRKK